MSLFAWFKRSTPIAPELRPRLEDVRRMAAPQFPEIDQHLPQLAEAVASAWAHCSGIAARIPGPISIARSAFAEDPVVHALFSSADDIAAMFGTSRCVRENFPRLAMRAESCHAMLGLRMAEKCDLGWGTEGSLLVANCSRRIIYFTDHTLAEPAEHEEDVRAKIAERLFQGLLTDFVAEVRALRQHFEEARVAAGLARAQSRTSGFLDSAVTHAESEHHLAQALGEIRPSALAARLRETLNSASQRLRLEFFTLHLDRLGVLHEPDDPDATPIEFARLSGRDRRQWIVFLVHVRHDEIRQALERFQEATRYIVI
ncbi:MAG: hypothetical protein N2441_00855 [Rhodocyclaceae bacterium]|nr:hypothetical protein [Rhodocyclaceae bacterium]